MLVFLEPFIQFAGTEWVMWCRWLKYRLFPTASLCTHHGSTFRFMNIPTLCYTLQLLCQYNCTMPCKCSQMCKDPSCAHSYRCLNQMHLCGAQLQTDSCGIQLPHLLAYSLQSFHTASQSVSRTVRQSVAQSVNHQSVSRQSV